ncbi:MFS transporter [Actinomyces bowdenii]|uniref:MFS transporter n=1 Tax=Actinomyces bowdenii TaxID=131109 RepID=UPI00214B71A2|nr:MFS transporter [Actinomyces bowdenii]MCR2051424.1 MFS transporter [Actinomyces bowdenii]
MASPYSRVLAHPGARSFSAAGLIARFPMSMVGISTILAVESIYEEYFAAGLVSAVNIVAVAIGAPLLARLVDARGQSRVMVPATLASGAALAGLIAATTMRMPLVVIVVLSALAGGLAGSMGSLVRARWTALLHTPEDIHTAFSLEAALDEVAFIIGPVLATALSTSPFLPVTSGWAAALVMQIVGGLWFLSQRATEPVPHAHGHAGGQEGEAAEAGDGAAPDGRGAASAGGGAPSAAPTRVLAHSAVLAIVLVFLASGAMFGALDIAVVSRTEEAGAPSAAGLLLAAWSAGSLTAALVYGSRSWGWPLWKQLLVGLVVFAAGTSTFLAAPGLVILGVLMMITGMAIAPTITTGNNIIQVTVAPSQLTEGLAWVGTSLNIGVSLGSLLGGRVIDSAGSTGGFLVVTAFAWVALLVCLGRLRTLRQVRTSGSHLGTH